MINLETALLRANLVGTMLDEPQLCYLYALAAMAPDGPSAECGVYKGGSLAVWAAAREGRGPVYASDTWATPRWLRALSEFERIKRLCNEEWSLDVYTLQCSSWVAAGLASAVEPVAFCFIDADHTVDGIPRDMQAWPQAIAPGGILAMHDYISSKATCAVKHTVDAWQAKANWHYLGIVGSIIAFMRPRNPDGPKIGGTK